MRPRPARATLVGISLVAMVASGCADAPDDRAEARLAASGGSTSTTGSDWRTERWHGVQVRVPREWAWGSAPVRLGRHVSGCGGPPERPHVGRPIPASDACGVLDLTETPRAESVWLGVDLEPGVVDLPDGWTRETVEAEGTTVTVTTQDDGLRAAVLASAAPVTRCRASLGRAPKARRDVTVEGAGDLVDASLCVYQRRGRTFDLQYGTSLAQRAVDGVERVADRAPRRGEACPGRPYELVVITARFADPFDDSNEPDPVLTHRFVYEMGFCSQLTTKQYHRRGQVERRLTGATVRPWATERYRHLLTGPSVGWAYRYFIGVQG